MWKMKGSKQVEKVAVIGGVVEFSESTGLCWLALTRPSPPETQAYFHHHCTYSF